ncbi:hypothetical protein [Patulibacter defluvii]|uniref:hypothetical protein n=1 Tax=Patulibacter defluvii TaxID=3095358 RepID=UPI002A74E5E4|nr:hypothetical protein [Patulibacter sp. DM4]
MSVVDIPRQVAVVEDDRQSGEAICRRLGRRGFETHLILPSTPGLDETIAEIKAVSGVALCDHRLRDGLQVDFSGADLVAELFSQDFPSVLFTGVQPEEKHAIRRNLDRIPGFLHRDDEGGLGAARLLGAMQDSVDEVLGRTPPAHRRARRTPITVLELHRSGGEALLEILISGWPGGQPIIWPADVLAERWHDRPADAEGKTFFGWCNTGEPRADKVFLRDVEPEPQSTASFFRTTS